MAAGRARRIEQRALWVDRVIDQAIARGDFDHNPHAGRPLPGINCHHEPDWWVRGLIERERRQLCGGPPVITGTRDVEAEVAAWCERRGGSSR